MAPTGEGNYEHRHGYRRGHCFLPVKVGLVGLWAFLVSAIIAYPAMYLFQKLFINTLAEFKECVDYPSVITGYLGKNWGFLLGVLYFIMLLIWVFAYSTAITNDSASYLRPFHITKMVLSHNSSTDWLQSASWSPSLLELKKCSSRSPLLW